MISTVEPNPSHRVVTRLESAGLATGVVTQNVDGLHRKAGQKTTIELHGNLARVVCLDCGAVESRQALQLRIVAGNPQWNRRRVEEAPDGDAELPEEISRAFRMPRCLECGGVLKPDVVFFGENVPAPRVEEVFRMVDEADALLVLGSSLKVYSGFRFVERAARLGRPIGIVNLGETRGDGLASLRLDAPLLSVLPRLSEMLGLEG